MRSLLMGGQACVLFGGAEFSRDTDILVLADDDNLDRLSAAVADLEAAVIAVPSFEADYLARGHAVHFRCRRPDVAGMRLDVMAKLRGLPDFATLWNRRTTLETPGYVIDTLSLPDLVVAKKTQRDKDWPMIARLVEAHYARHAPAPEESHVEFWLREARTAAMLMAVAAAAPKACARLVGVRPLLAHALAGCESALAAALREEEEAERAADRLYWAPLKRELEQLRHAP